MKLYLMRHAPAVAGADADPSREITQDASRYLAQLDDQWLSHHLPTVKHMLASNMLRAQQTAQVFASLGEDVSVEVDDGLAVGTDLSANIEVLERFYQSTPDAQGLLVVSHQPIISSLLMFLTGDNRPVYPEPLEIAVLECDWPAQGLAQLLRWLRP